MGLAQVSMSPPYSIQEHYKRLRYDLDYIKNRNLLMDMGIISKTILIFVHKIIS